MSRFRHSSTKHRATDDRRAVCSTVCLRLGSHRWQSRPRRSAVVPGGCSIVGIGHMMCALVTRHRRFCPCPQAGTPLRGSGRPYDDLVQVAGLRLVRQSSGLTTRGFAFTWNRRADDRRRAERYFRDSAWACTWTMAPRAARSRRRTARGEPPPRALAHGPGAGRIPGDLRGGRARRAPDQRGLRHRVPRRPSCGR